jgi:hypothetical protein
MEKTDLESLLKKMIDSGVDMSQYRKSPTKLVVPAHMLMAAQKVFGNVNRHEIEVDFDE